MDTSQMSEDDTIRDSSESGYVATRPRYTRARRTWKVNVRNISLEDIRGMQNFRDNIVKRGSLAFYMPSLIKNGSFEIAAEPGSGDLADQWQASAGSPVLSSTALDGGVAVQVASPAGLSAPGVNLTIGGVQYGGSIAANPGDTISVGFWYRVLATSQPLYFETALLYQYEGQPEKSVATATIVGATINATWAQALATIQVPSAGDASALKYLTLRINVNIDGASSEPTLGANEIQVLLDFVGAAVSATAQKQALMVGSSAITRQVRFTKLPEFADLGWVGGEKRYGATFEVTEL